MPLTNPTEDIPALKTNQKRLETLMIAVIIVLLVGFFALAFALATILVDGYRSKEGTYQDLVNKVNEQNYIINTLVQQNKIKRH